MHPDITLTEVDGIPALMAPRVGRQVSAGLFFRVGAADETLATRGITHLVEHLALHRHGTTDLHYNGATADTFTHFHVEGSREHVVEYLNGVCSALADLPVDRLETEKEILRTEERGRGTGPAPQLPLWRYGAQGYGLSSYNELGLSNLDAGSVRGWARTHFTRENAVLWITDDEVPPGLDLSLPRGRRNPAPAVTSALPTTPAWFPAAEASLVMEAVVPRSTAARVFAQVLSRALWADLRQNHGYSYTAAADYRPRDADDAVVVAMADCLPEKREAAIGAFVDVLARLRFGTITDTELASAKETARRSLDEPNFASLALPAYAVDLLLGRERASLEELEAEIDAVTATDLRTMAEAVHASALVQVPALGLDWAGFARAPEYSPLVVEGAEFGSRDPEAGVLVVGQHGVSLRGREGGVTVLFRDVVAVLAYPDGGRRLIGRDGFSVGVEPTLHPVDATHLRLVEGRVPPELVVPMPPRDPERMPRPAAPERRPGRRHTERSDDRPVRGPVRSAARRVVQWVLVAASLFLLLVAVVATDGAARGLEDMTWGGAVICWLLFAGSLGLTIRHRLRR